MIWKTLVIMLFIRGVSNKCSVESTQNHKKINIETNYKTKSIYSKSTLQQLYSLWYTKNIGNINLQHVYLSSLCAHCKNVMLIIIMKKRTPTFLTSHQNTDFLPGEKNEHLHIFHMIHCDLSCKTRKASLHILHFNRYQSCGELSPCWTLFPL